MKKFRKIMAILVAAVMIVAMAVPAWAATDTTQTNPGAIYYDTPTDGRIVIKNAIDNEDYKAYKMLTLISYNDDTNTTNNHASDAYSYAVLSTSKWVEFFDNGGAGKKWIYIDKPNAITIDTKTYYLAYPQTVNAADGSTVNFKNAFANGGATVLDEDTETEYPSTAVVQSFAQAARKFVSDNSTYFTTTLTETEDTPYSGTKVESNTLAFDPVGLGYYLVDSSVGTLCSVDTTNNTVEILEKNELPLSVKKVQEDSVVEAANKNLGDKETGYQDVNDATIGQVIWFRDVIELQKGAENYIFSDRMTAGLEVDTDTIQVFYVPNGQFADTTKWIELKNGNTVSFSDEDFYHTATHTTKTSLEKSDFYSLADSENYHAWTATPAEASDFEIVFVQAFLTYISDHIATGRYTDESAEDTTKLVVYYSAKLTNSAKISSKDNWNESRLFYGDNKVTAIDKTVTYTWPIELYKYFQETGKTGSPGPLPDAKFILSDDPDGEDAYDGTDNGPYKFVDISTATTDPEYLASYNGTQYKVVPSDYAGGDAVTTIVTPNTGKVRIVGLDAGTYYLTETVAPAGYNKLSHPIKVDVTRTTINDTTEVDDDVTETVTYSFGNKTTTGGAVDYSSVSTYTVAAGGGAATNGGMQIQNHTSTELPSTGGMGTTVLYIVGGMLVILAGAYLFFSRKKVA